MATSKFKAYGIFALIFSGILFAGLCFAIYTLLSVVFLGGHIIPRGTLPPFGAIFFIALFTILLSVIFNSWTHYAFKIKIDTKEKTIHFKNVITQQSSFYSFHDFDSYLDTYAVTRSGAYKVLYLIKDNKAEKIITGFYYANIDELKEAISSIKYFGFQKDYSTIARKALFNKTIIDERKA